MPAVAAPPPEMPSPDATRRRLVDAGLLLFGRAGLDGVSTRALAEAARVNLAAIPYHFGGKEALYLAVARHVVETTGAAMRLAAEAATAGAGSLTPAEARERAGALLASAVRVVLEAPDAAARGGFILREQLQPTAAFDLLYDGFMHALHVGLTALVARATGRRADDSEAIIRAHALLGQALVFSAARGTLARRLGREAPGPDEPAAIARAVAGLTVAALSRAAEAGNAA